MNTLKSSHDLQFKFVAFTLTGLNVAKLVLFLLFGVVSCENDLTFAENASK